MRRFSPKALFGCAYTLTTDYPLHVALGNLAPQNGFAFGVAFSERYTPNEDWRLSWSGDAVAAPSGSWRAGAYMKIVRTRDLGVRVATPGSAGGSGPIEAWEHPVVDIYAQWISLGTINYFGPGQASAESGRSVYGERQTIVGGTGTFPLTRLKAIRGLRPAIIAGVSGRFVTIRSGDAGEAPSIEQVYDEVAAPGLSEQSPFVEFHEGLRFRPSVANGWLRFNYLLAAQQFRTRGDTLSSFNRWTVDLRHEIPLYRGVSSAGPRAFNSPNECAQAVGSPACPPVSWSRNRQGTIGIRLLVERLHHERRQSGAVLLSADARRLRHQRRTAAGELPGLPLPRAESAGAAGERRALALGPDRRLRPGRTGQSGGAVQRP